jgi:hypothetical protein
MKTKARKIGIVNHKTLICHLRIKSAQVFMDLNFKSAHLILDLLSYP